MVSPASGTRDRILEAAYVLFYREGFSRVSVDAIAEASNVTKRTVYYHFKSKDDIVADVLDNQHRYLLQQFQEWTGPVADGPGAMIEILFANLKKWADGPHWLGSGFTRITMELADMPGHPARRAASSHKAEIEQWLAGQFSAAGLGDSANLSRQIMIVVEGSMSLSLIHRDTAYIRSAAGTARALVGNAQRQTGRNAHRSATAHIRGVADTAD